MSTNNPNEIAISEAELSSMTRELDTMHKETFSGVRKSLDDFSANLAHLATGRSTARRSFLLGAGGLAVVGGVAACSSSGGSKPATSSSDAGASPYTGDLKVVALAAALENLAIAAYGMALTAAGKGSYGAVPPAIGTFITTAMKQHQDHAGAWNAVLTKAGLKPVTTPALSITNAEVAKLQAAKTIPDVAKVALSLENVAAETYTFATANVTDAGGIMTAATIQPVEAMHAAILSFVLGEYPVPASFIGVDMSLQPAMLTV